MHVGHMASHVCDTWQAMCVTHGMPCVNMHGTFEGYKRGAPIQFLEKQGEGGGREKRRGGKEKRKGGKEKRKGGKEMKREEETMRRKKRKRGKRNRKRKECRAVSRPRQQRTQNYATRGRFPHTLVILCLGVV